MSSSLVVWSPGGRAPPFCVFPQGKGSHLPQLPQSRPHLLLFCLPTFYFSVVLGIEPRSFALSYALSPHFFILCIAISIVQAGIIGEISCFCLQILGLQVCSPTRLCVRSCPPQWAPGTRPEAEGSLLGAPQTFQIPDGVVLPSLSLSLPSLCPHCCLGEEAAPGGEPETPPGE